MTQSSILIISTPQDVHYQAIHYGLCKAGIHSDLMSFNNFPQFDCHSVHIDRHHINYSINLFDGKIVNLFDYPVIWNRRAVSPVISAELSAADRIAAEGEARMFIEGMKLISNSDQCWINDPTVERNSGQKPYQLYIARKCGMNVPRTLMTNSQPDLIRFMSSLSSKAIIKTFYPATWHSDEHINMAYATRVSVDDFSDISSVSFTSNLIQEYIDKLFEIRVFFMGGAILAVKIASQESEQSKTDWRAAYDGSLKISELLTLPDDLLASINRFCSEMGLLYGAFDFIFTPDGDYVFLECNPSGQFIFVEEWEPSIRSVSAFLLLLTKNMDISKKQRELLASFKLSDFTTDVSAQIYYNHQSENWPVTVPQTFHYPDISVAPNKQYL